jgi:hypothetical protein
MGLLGGVVFYLTVLTPVQRELVGYLLGSAFNWFGAVAVAGDMSIGQRVLEIINVGETLSRSGAWLWGLGWGAPWSEIAVHHPFDKGSFPIQEQLTGVHTTAHLDFVYFVLKVGIIGAALIYSGLLRFCLAAFRLAKAETGKLPKLALIGILVFLIVVIPNYVYFVKLKCLMGIAFGCIAWLMSAERTSDGETRRS